MKFKTSKEVLNKNKKVDLNKITKKVFEITDKLPTVKLEEMLKEDLDRWEY